VCILQLLLLQLGPALLYLRCCLLKQPQPLLLLQRQQRLHVQVASGKLRGVHEYDTHLTLPQPQHIV
jgi:hypothetical protein